MIRLPEGYTIHKQDKTRLMGGNWSVRVMYYDAKMNKHDVFIMCKNNDVNRIGPKYAARLYNRTGAEWIEFDNEQDMCIAMCTQHRMLIR